MLASLYDTQPYKVDLPLACTNVWIIYKYILVFFIEWGIYAAVNQHIFRGLNYCMN